MTISNEQTKPEKRTRQSEPYISGGWSPSPALLALRSLMTRTMMKSRCQAPPRLTLASLQTHILHTEDKLTSLQTTLATI
ncbi:hypothetical protein ACE6H2_026916 [Prunus campanulata]